MRSATARCRCGAPRAALRSTRLRKAPAAGRNRPQRPWGSPRRRAGLRPTILAASGAFSPQSATGGGSVRPCRASRFRGWWARAAADQAPASTGVSGSVAMLGLLVPLLGLALAYFALLDGWYLVRLPCAVLHARLLQPRVRDLLAEQRYAGRVLPSDLDLLLHMNNARYLREADVARTVHLVRCGVLEALRALGGRTVLAASCARYRRSLRLLEPFEVRTRLLGWDDRAFYLEARFISLRDGFVCALLRSRQHVLGTSPERIVQHLCKRKVEPPELPEDLRHWTAYNEASSRQLRAESGLSDVVKDQ